jgi:hypothetical protein
MGAPPGTLTGRPLPPNRSSSAARSPRMAAAARQRGLATPFFS